MNWNIFTQRFVEKWINFQTDRKGTDVGQRFWLVLTTFFAMSYIFICQSAMLAQTEYAPSRVFSWLELSGLLQQVLMAFFANLPYAQAPGMGLNAFSLLQLSLPRATLGRKPWLWSLSVGLFRSLSHSDQGA